MPSKSAIQKMNKKLGVQSAKALGNKFKKKYKKFPLPRILKTK